MHMRRASYDVAIVGGGPAGIATAMALNSRHDLSVAVLEKSDYSNFRVGETLPPQGQSLLSHLGLWSGDDSGDRIPSAGIRSNWESETCGHLDFICNPFGTGWHLDRRSFDSGLARIAAKEGIDVLTRHAFIGQKKLKSGCHRALFSLDDGGQLHVDAKVFVDATGRAAVVARSFGAKRHFIDRLVAICGVVESTTGSVTHIEATEQGWWYAATLPDEQTMIVFLTDADVAHRLQLGKSEHWWAALRTTKNINEFVPADARLCIPVKVFAAQSVVLDASYGSVWLAAGDSAQAFDPLSSQGIYAACRSGIDAASCIGKMITGDRQPLETRHQGLQAHFSAYLQTRELQYSKVRRWPQSQFWQRRGNAITLSPVTCLRLRSRTMNPTAILHVSPVMNNAEVAQLAGIFKEAKFAFEGVRKFSEEVRSDLPTKSIIRALQELNGRGVLTRQNDIQ